MSIPEILQSLGGGAIVVQLAVIALGIWWLIMPILIMNMNKKLTIKLEEIHIELEKANGYHRPKEVAPPNPFSKG